MGTINNRIEELILKLTNGNKRAFATKIGVSATAIENIVGKRQGKPGFEILEKIIYSFEYIDANWLIVGKGNMLKGNEVKMENVSNKELLDRIERLCEEKAELKIRLLELEREKKIEQPPPYFAAAEPELRYKKK